MSNSKNVQNVLASKDIFLKYINMICDSDQTTKREAIKSVIFTGKSQPSMMVSIILEKLNPRINTLTPEFFEAYFELLQKFFEESPSDILKSHQRELYGFLKNIIRIMMKGPVENQQLNNVYRKNEDAIMSFFEDMAKIDEDAQYSFVMEFVDSQSIPDLLVFVLLLQLNRFQPTVIANNINDLITKLIPLLQLAKTADDQLEVCNLFVNILESFIQSDEGSESYKNTKAVLSQLMSSVFEILRSSWLVSKDSRVRILSHKLLGLVVELLPTKKVTEIMDKTLNLYIDFLKKEKGDTLKAFEGFNRALERFMKENQKSVGTMVKSILVSMHPLFMSNRISPNSKNLQENIKYTNQVYKTLQLFGTLYGNEIFEYYLTRLESPNRDEIIPALWITRHLIGRCHQQIGDHLKRTYFGQMRVLSEQPDFEIRFALIEIILSLVTNNLLKRDEDKAFFLEYLLKQVSIHPQEIIDNQNRRSEGYETTLDLLYDRSCQILYLISGDKHGQNLTWPDIMGALTNTQYSPGLPVIVKNLAYFINKNADDLDKLRETYMQSKTLPRPHQLLVRLLLVSYLPLIFKNLGYEVLGSLQALFKVLDPSIDIPKPTELQNMLKSGVLKNENLYFERLESYIANLINKLPSEEWRKSLNKTIIDGYSTYQANENFLNALLKIHGMTLSKAESVDVVREGLEKLFQVCHPEYTKNLINGHLAPQVHDETLRLSVAKGIGLAAAHNFECAFEFLKEAYTAEAIAKKQGGFSSLFKSGATDHLKEPVRMTVLTALGYICSYGNPVSFMKKFEVSILPFIMTNIEVSKTDQLKLACFKALTEICKALNKLYEFDDTLITQDFKLYVSKQREKVLQKLTEFQMSESNFDVVLQTYMAEAIISRVSPALHEEFYFERLNHLLHLIPNSVEHKNIAYIEPLNETVITLLYRDDIKTIVNEEVHYLQPCQIMIRILDALNEQLILLDDAEIQLLLVKNIIDSIVKALNNKKLSEPKSQEQNQFFFRTLNEMITFVHVEDQDVSGNAKLTVSKLILSIGGFTDPSADNEELYEMIVDALAKKFGAKEIVLNFSIDLLKLMRIRHRGFHGLKAIFSIIYKKFQEEVKADQEELIQKFFEILDEMQAQAKKEEEELEEVDPQKQDVEDAIVTVVVDFMKSDLKELLNLFLKRKPEFPLPRGIAQCLHKVISEKSLLTRMFNYLTDILNNPEQVMYADTTTMMFNATLFLGVIMESKEQVIVDLTKRYFYQILGTYLLRFGTTYESRINPKYSIEKDAIKYALWSFQNFLVCAENKPIADALEGYGLQRKLASEFDEGVSELFLIVTKNCTFENMKTLVEFLKPFLSKKIEQQKEIVVIILAQSINYCMFLAELTDDYAEFFPDFEAFQDWIIKIANAMIELVENKSEIVRKYCYRGLGNITFLHNLKTNPKIVEAGQNVDKFIENTEKKSQEILKILLRGLDDSSISCVKESLNSFQRLSDTLNYEYIYNYHVEIFNILRPSFESDDARLRMSSFNLCGKIFKTIISNNSSYLDDLMEEMHINLVPIILHLNDESSVVRQSCINALAEVAGPLKLPQIKEIVTDKNLDKGELSHLDNAEVQTVKLANIIQNHFPNKLGMYIYGALDFTKSPEEVVRASAIFFLLALINTIDLDKKDINLPNFDEVMSKALEDKETIVRKKFLKGYSLLTNVHNKLSTVTYTKTSK